MSCYRIVFDPAARHPLPPLDVLGVDGPHDPQLVRELVAHVHTRLRRPLATVRVTVDAVALAGWLLADPDPVPRSLSCGS